MNIRITVKNGRTANTWDEDYAKPDITTIEQAKQWAKDLVNWFNETGSVNAATRVLLNVRELEAGEGHPRTTRR